MIQVRVISWSRSWTEQVISSSRASDLKFSITDHLFDRRNTKYTQRIVFTKVHDVEFCHSLEQVVKHTLPALALLKAQGKVR